MKFFLSILLLITSLYTNAQIEPYFTQYYGTAETINAEKHIVTVTKTDTTNCEYFATKKEIILNPNGTIQQITEHKNRETHRYIYNYHKGRLNSSKIYFNDEFVATSTINYITCDSIIEVLLDTKQKPIGTKIITKKPNVIRSQFLVSKDGVTNNITEIYQLNKKGLVEKHTQEKRENKQLYSTTEETTTYLKFDEFGNYTEAFSTIDNFSYRTIRKLTYKKLPPPVKHNYTYIKPTKFTKLGIGYNYNFGKPNSKNFHLLDIFVSREKQYPHANAYIYSIGTEVSLNTHKIILGPKIGVQARLFGGFLGMSLVNYTDFTDNTLRLVPEIGFDGDEVRFTLKPQITLTNKNFTPVNNISASLIYFLKF